MKQAPPQMAVQLRGPVIYIHRRVWVLPTPAERITSIRDVGIFCVALPTMTRGVELSVATASQVLQMTGG